MELSVIVPIFNEEPTITIFYDKINEVLTKNNIEHELIFIDDGSKDNSLSIIKDLVKQNQNIKYASFSRNFGKESAILAGLKKATGTYTTVMDVDLQDPPQLLTDMLKLIKEKNLDCVETKRENRKGEPVIRSLFAKTFCKLMNAVCDVKIIDGVRDFRLMKRNIVDAMISLNEPNRFSKGLFSWVGFKTECITYPNIERIAGQTKWSFCSLFKYALNGIISFTTFPLYLPLAIGVILFLLGLAGCILTGFEQEITKQFFLYFVIGLTGLNGLFIGFLGLYISKIYEGTQNRPHYIIREEN